ncbi:phage portal protein [Yoonia sp.]|uniref:phage portal protein n=1 Tax=Yoonia sp. TaxID=2212373 RepID=UPI00391B8C0E
MEIFTNVKKALGFRADTKSLNLTDPGVLEIFGAAPSASGIHVSAAAAMRVPAVACAVALISETIGSLPCKIFDSATKETAKTHPAYRLIHDEANPWTSAAQLREDLTLDALTRDQGGFALVTRYTDGRPAEMYRIDPASVTVLTAPDGEPTYRVQTADGPVIYSFTDMLHIKPFGGVCPITLGKEAIGLAIAFEHHISALFRNGARPSGIITSPKILDVETKKKISVSFLNTHGGRNVGGTAILDEGMAYQQLSMTLADAQFAENRIEQIREIARVFRVPPTMLFELSRGTWSNVEEMSRQFLAITLKPWLIAWTWAYARVLLTAEERSQFNVEFVIDDLVTTDLATRAAAYSQYRAMGVMTGNEVRAGLNMPDHPEGASLSNPHITTATPALEEAAA